VKSSAIVKRLLPLVYFLIVSLPHHFFSDLFDKYLLIPFGMGSVQSWANVVSVGLILGVGALGVYVMRVQRRAAVRHFLVWLATLSLIYAADRYFIVNNIERIHFPQYAVLAMLLSLSLPNHVLNFFVTCFAGLIDEFLQFVMNPSRTNYLDFNDIVLNILGAALGVIIVLSLTRKKQSIPGLYESRLRLAFFGIVSAIVLMTGAAFASGRVAMFADVPKDHRHVFAVVDGKLSFVLSFERNDYFWQVADNGKQFHAMTFYEAVVLIAVLSFLYRFIIMWLERTADPFTPQTHK